MNSDMARGRVVITGLGVVAPNGIGKEAFWKALISGKSGIGKITHFDASSYPCQIAGEVHGFDPLDFMTAKTARKAPRFVKLAIAAAQLAIRDSGIDLDRFNGSHAGIFIGNSMGGLDFLEEQVSIFHEKGLGRVNPYAPIMVFPHSAASLLAIEYKIRGPNLTISTGCPAGINAVAVATREIRRGNIDLALVCGADAPISPITVAAFCASKGLAGHDGNPAKASRPFDRYRSGYVLSEGAGAAFLEGFKHASHRSATMYGEVLGCSSTNDAYSIYDIDPAGIGLHESMQKALLEARVDPQEIEYISAHAPSIVSTDKVETDTIKRLLGEYAYRVPISSIKSMTGQALAATGIFQLVACLLSFRDSVVPPTINYEYPDPECDLDYVPNKARHRAVRTAMINTHGFGGLNATLVVRKTI